LTLQSKLFCSSHNCVLTFYRTTCEHARTHQADMEVKAATAEIDRLEEVLKRGDLSGVDRDALMAELKAARVRLALAEERRRKAVERKAALRAGNHLLHQKLQDALGSETVQEALVKEAEALLAKSIADDSQEINTDATQVRLKTRAQLCLFVFCFFDCQITPATVSCVHTHTHALDNYFLPRYLTWL
jgi:flagellar hook-length control protein FliK